LLVLTATSPHPILLTCVNTLAASHINSAASHATAPSIRAEDKKHRKYASLSERFIFIPVAIETLGCWGPEAMGFVNDLGRRLSTVSGDSRASNFLKQKISVAIMRDNADCIKQSFPSGLAFNELFYI
ncbi:MAG: hypothetical protein AAGK05_17820, partial [Pseudomonadota bacterium]